MQNNLRILEAFACMLVYLMMQNATYAQVSPKSIPTASQYTAPYTLPLTEEELENSYRKALIIETIRNPFSAALRASANEISASVYCMIAYIAEKSTHYERSIIFYKTAERLKRDAGDLRACESFVHATRWSRKRF
ncbi:hypothetical protein [Aromatoleum anaerobium]|uniref:Tetratricopeptide repeat protein n=1 Tax=Aromatoleum anaerobium TaxID=182180 RepID=A0ABX1PN15_9RHOO|nr:hypothetical protein [Aromatoleum anaerobium]MCK0506067.1 hypothetical protein [Aromatoleum anaerobium]